MHCACAGISMNPLKLHARRTHYSPNPNICSFSISSIVLTPHLTPPNICFFSIASIVLTPHLTPPNICFFSIASIVLTPHPYFTQTFTAFPLPQLPSTPIPRLLLVYAEFDASYFAQYEYFYCYDIIANNISR